jgi:hypothetical protein
MSTQVVETSTGKVFNLVGGCRDDWPTIRTMTVCGQQLRMQLPAIRAYRQACREFAHLLGWSDERIKRTGGRAILLTGSSRSCELQTELHAGDPKRFADPNVSLHPEGLAIDVNTVQPFAALAYKALAHVGWVRVRPTDEPWHHSWGVKA